MLRQVWLTCHKVKSDALFFAMGGDHSFMSDNSIRRLKAKVEEAIGEKFELRDCRRAFGQYYLDKGLELTKVSVLMGHDCTKTREQYYCRSAKLKPSKTPERSGERRVRRKDLIVLEDQGIE